MPSDSPLSLPLIQQQIQQAFSQRPSGEFRAILDKVSPFSMVPEGSLVELVHKVQAILTFNIPGDFVECGVWRGGASFLIAELLRRSGVCDRKVWLFDSFEGLPEPEALDGKAAMEYCKDPKSPWYFDNCRASLTEVQRNANRLGLGPYTEFVKGWFENTLPQYRHRIGPIALLRVDCDWYSSVRCCLENLYDQVVDGGFVVLDDYYAWEGCVIAVHEFLAERQLTHRMESSGSQDSYYAAIFRKGGGRTTWKWVHKLYLTRQDIEGVVPQKETCILVDQAQFGNIVTGGRRTLPFLECDGNYWGPPPDDDTAIRELERMRQIGARFIVFGWPAFWWLDYYAAFHSYLRDKFPCVLRNDRLIIFDLHKGAKSPHQT